MWEKIKKFFKWIADHTGISWIARKISSGWKWLFGGKASATQQNTSQQEKSPEGEEQKANNQSKSTTLPKTLDDEVNPDQLTPPKQPASSNKPKPESTECIEISGEKLRLVVNKDKEDFMEASKNPSNSEEYLVYIEHAKGTLKITGPNLQCVSAGNENQLLSFAINSVASQDGKTVSGELAEMKKMLGLDENKKFIKITGIFGTLNQSNTNAIVNGATQQDNDSNKEVAAEEYASSSTTPGQQSDLNAGTKEIDNLQASANVSTPSSDGSSFEVISGLTPPTSPEPNGKTEKPATMLDGVQSPQQSFSNDNEKNGQSVGKS